ncbi:MAG: hypothetical protein ABR981_00235 [Candidatus Micrarchaeaceae archaeon]|jgi:hypothetical protein
MEKSVKVSIVATIFLVLLALGFAFGYLPRVLGDITILVLFILVVYIIYLTFRKMFRLTNTQKKK